MISTYAQNQEDSRVQAMADRIVDYARLCMANKKRISPFERAAAREGLYYRGGVCNLRRYSSAHTKRNFVFRKWMT